MLDTLPSHSDPDDFNTVPGAWPDPGGFLPEARTGAREAAARMKDLAERFAELRNAIMRLPGNPVPRRPRRAPPPASPSGTHLDEREGQPRRRHHRHHGRRRRGSLTTRAALAAHNRANGPPCDATGLPADDVVEVGPVAPAPAPACPSLRRGRPSRKRGGAARDAGQRNRRYRGHECRAVPPARRAGRGDAVGGAALESVFRAARRPRSIGVR